MDLNVFLPRELLLAIGRGSSCNQGVLLREALFSECLCNLNYGKEHLMNT